MSDSLIAGKASNNLLMAGVVGLGAYLLWKNSQKGQISYNGDAASGQSYSAGLQGDSALDKLGSVFNISMPPSDTTNPNTSLPIDTKKAATTSSSSSSSGGSVPVDASNYYSSGFAASFAAAPVNTYDASLGIGKDSQGYGYSSMTAKTTPTTTKKAVVTPTPAANNLNTYLKPQYQTTSQLAKYLR